ncbi:MAG: hypothetical protein ACMUJM_23995 [bacterium]
MSEILSRVSERKKNILAVILITALAFVIYSNSLYSPFHFDDQHSIVENCRIHRFDLKEILHTSRPVLELTLALNYYFGKLNVFGYHLVNLLLHIFNAIMIYFILQYTLKFPVFSEEMRDKYRRVPLYSALIFVSHPIQTESVTYIISRSSVLATFFYLFALLLFLLAHRIKEYKYRYLFYGGCLLASLLGMGSKPIVATLPIMIMLYDFYFIQVGNTRKVVKRYALFYLLLVLIFAGLVYFNFHGLQEALYFDYAMGASHEGQAEMVELEDQYGPLNSIEYFITQLNVIPYYIKLLFIPTNLNLDYDFPKTRHMDLKTLVYLVLLLALFSYGICTYKKSRLLSYSILWFFITLSVTSSFVVILDVIFEHRLYLPSVGFATFLAIIICNIFG